jgi:hypothetical protein
MEKSLMDSCPRSMLLASSPNGFPRTDRAAADSIQEHLLTGLVADLRIVAEERTRASRGHFTWQLLRRPIAKRAYVSSAVEAAV